MVKVHTRMKRRLGISTHKSGNVSTVAKKKGPKTFPSEESANAYATNNDINDFKLINNLGPTFFYNKNLLEM